MSQGPPARTPFATVTCSVTSDPHSWELMGGGGRAEPRPRSLAVRLKVRARRDPCWLGCATVATSGQGWNLRHREDTTHLARSSLPGPSRPDWLSGWGTAPPSNVGTGYMNDFQSLRKGMSHCPLTAVPLPLLPSPARALTIVQGPNKALAYPEANFGAPNSARTRSGPSHGCPHP